MMVIKKGTGNMVGSDTYCKLFTRENNPPAPLPPNERKIIARRAALELAAEKAAFLGRGIPEGIVRAAYERGILHEVVLTDSSGRTFGTAHTEKMKPDQCFLEFFQCGLTCDKGRYGLRIGLSCGYAEACLSCRQVVFCGPFTSGGLRVKTGGGVLSVRQEGGRKTFCSEADMAAMSGVCLTKYDLLLITERAVFRFSEKTGLILTEIAPGIDLEKDILNRMDFMPEISPGLKGLDPAVFWL
ncbi:MAG: hypothetical protein ACYCX2_05100 [Christensenellales bacterium]